MEGRGSGPYFDPDFDFLVERINPRVCIDNETCEDCTLVKVDSANRNGILLEMVQLLTDLDLVISKSYISSDGGWLMDVFHVGDRHGNKLTDPDLIRYIQQSLVSGQKGARSADEVTTCLGKLVGPGHLASEHAAVEITATDRPGLLSEIAAVLAELHCHVACAQAWTHNSCAAVILHVIDEPTRRPIADADRLAHVEQQVDSVVEAHHEPSERRRVKVSGPMPSRVHMERRLHQLMYEDGDYETGPPPPPANGDQFADANLEARRDNVLFLWSPSSSSSSTVTRTRASIDNWKERGYTVVNIQSRDRPKLLFDTVCTLTDMKYVVYHAAVGSRGPLAVQEYYVRRMDGCTLDTESERQKVSRCLVAAVERRACHGSRLDVSTRDRRGLLSDITRVLRENGLSLTMAEYATLGERAVGTFYVTDASGGGNVDPKSMEAVREELGESVTLVVRAGGWGCAKSNSSTSSSTTLSPSLSTSSVDGDRSRIMTSLGSSLGSLLWSHIERLSSNFGSIRS